MTTTTFDAATASGLPGPDWLRAARRVAAERVATQPLPTDAEEVWRYSRIAEFDLDAYAPVADGAAGETDIGTMLTSAPERAGLAIVRNGHVASCELDAEVAAQGVELLRLSEVDDGDALLGSVAASSTDLFTEMNSAFLSDAVVVRVPSGVVVERPIVVVQWCDVDGGAVFPRTIVAAGADSEVTVLERQGSAAVRAWVAPVVELHAGPAARLGYVNVQQLEPTVWQTGYHASTVDTDATLRWSVVALGGDYARVRTDSRLVGRGATSHLEALYFGEGTQMHDFRTMQDHAAPSTTSDLLFKGAVQDHSQSVYSGLIRVRKEARGTNAFQTNRNLVLSEGARAESVPNLEIETNDVRCSHASAVGPIDEEQRYYLESRGVPPEVAERLIVLGFFADVLERLPVPGLTERLRAAVADKLTRRSDRL